MAQCCPERHICFRSLPSAVGRTACQSVPQNKVMSDDYLPLPQAPQHSPAPTLAAVWRESIGGAGAGVVGTLLGYPFDCIKTRMQTSGCTGSEAVKSIVNESGVLGLYRGMSSPLTALTILNTLNFSSYSRFCQLFGVSTDDKRNTDFDWRITVSAALVGPLASTVSTPFELIKTQTQLLRKNLASGLSPKGSESVRGTWSMTLFLVRNSGIRSLYAGHGVNTLREIVFLSTYFTVYENARRWVNTTTSVPEGIAVPLCGGLSGAVGWLVSFPLDNVKSNIQGSPFGCEKRRSSGQVFSEILRRKGFFGLYTGVLPSIVRAFIVSASRFTAYESILTVIDEY